MHSLSYIKKPYLSHANACACEVHGVHVNGDDDLVLFNAICAKFPCIICETLSKCNMIQKCSFLRLLYFAIA